MASAGPCSVVLCIAPRKASLLPPPTAHLLAFDAHDPLSTKQPPRKSSAAAADVASNDSPSFVRWSCQSDPSSPSTPVPDLTAELTRLNPAIIHVYLPSDAPAILPVQQARLLLLAEAAIHTLAPTANPSSPHPLPESSPSPSVYVSLVFEQRPMEHILRQYEALFAPRETLVAAAAASVLSARSDNLIPASAAWTGAFQLPSESSDTVASPPPLLPGLHVVRTPIVINSRQHPQPQPHSQTHSQPQSQPPGCPVLTAKHARILAVAKQLPKHAGLLRAYPGYALRLAQNCPPRTAAFYNALADSEHSLLVAIGDVLFWLFWRHPRRRDDSVSVVPTCHALWIAPLPSEAVGALDVFAWCMRQNFGEALFVRQLPQQVLDLPVRALFSDSLEETEVSRIGEGDETDSLRSTVLSLSGRCDDAAGGAACVGEEGDVKPSPDDMLVGGVSRAELVWLYNQEKEKKRTCTDVALTVGRVSNSVSRSESCSLLDSKGLPGRKDNSYKQTSELTMRRQRFQRLLQSQQDKRVVENATTVSTMGQRGKRVRTSDGDLARKRYNKAPRNSAASVYFEQAMRGKMHALENGKPFFRMDQGGEQRCYASLGEELYNIGRTVEPSRAVECAEADRRSHGQHGVEFLFDGDDRDRLILEYETLVSKTGQEFSSVAPYTPEQQTKIAAGVESLRRKASTQICPRESQHRRNVPNRRYDDKGVDNITETMQHVLRAFVDGRLIVKDESLRLTLERAAQVQW